MAFDGSRQWVHCNLCQQEHSDIRYVHEYQLMSAFAMLNRRDSSDFRTSTDAISLLRSFVLASRCHLRQLIQMWGKSASAEVVDAEIVRLDNQLTRVTGKARPMQSGPVVTNVRIEQISESLTSYSASSRAPLLQPRRQLRSRVRPRPSSWRTIQWPAPRFGAS